MALSVVVPGDPPVPLYSEEQHLNNPLGNQNLQHGNNPQPKSLRYTPRKHIPMQLEDKIHNLRLLLFMGDLLDKGRASSSIARRYMHMGLIYLLLRQELVGLY